MTQALPRKEDGRLDVAACLTFIRYIEGEHLRPPQLRNLARFLRKRYGSHDDVIAYRWFACPVRPPVGARLTIKVSEVFTSFAESLQSARHAGVSHHLDMGRRDGPCAVGKATARPLATHANLLDLIEHCAKLSEEGVLAPSHLTRPNRIRFSARRLAREAELFIETNGSIDVEVCKSWAAISRDETP